MQMDSLFLHLFPHLTLIFSFIYSIRTSTKHLRRERGSKQQFETPSMESFKNCKKLQSLFWSYLFVVATGSFASHEDHFCRQAIFKPTKGSTLHKIYETTVFFSRNSVEIRIGKWFTCASCLEWTTFLVTRWKKPNLRMFAVFWNLVVFPCPANL